MKEIHSTLEESSGREEFVYAKTDDIIRFHVKANSNSPGDQGIKNYLAEKIIRLYEPIWSQCDSSKELRLLLLENQDSMEIAARDILAEKGLTYDVNVSLEKRLFPARFYSGEFYPPGEYEALYMVIGEGIGENWWCVLFPPLCFAVVPSPTLSKGNADSEQAEISFAESVKKKDTANKIAKINNEGENIKIRFWLIELFQKFRI